MTKFALGLLTFLVAFTPSVEAQQQGKSPAQCQNDYRRCMRENVHRRRERFYICQPEIVRCNANAPPGVH